jgi:hypothetical protein
VNTARSIARSVALSAAAALGVLLAAGCSSTQDPAFSSIKSNLTPELQGIAERPSDIERNMAVVGNQNLRMFWGDLGRVFLFDQPSYLSPYNITSTTGQPN